MTLKTITRGTIMSEIITVRLPTKNPWIQSEPIYVPRDEAERIANLLAKAFGFVFCLIIVMYSIH